VSHYAFSLCCPALLSTSLLTLSVSSCGRLCNGTASVGPFVRLSVPAYIDSQYAAATCCWLAAAQQVASSVICCVPRCKDQHKVRFCSSFFSLGLYVRYTLAICDVWCFQLLYLIRVNVWLRELYFTKTESCPQNTRGRGNHCSHLSFLWYLFIEHEQADLDAQQLKRWWRAYYGPHMCDQRMRSRNKYPAVRARTNRFKNSFIPYASVNIINSICSFLCVCIFFLIVRMCAE